MLQLLATGVGAAYFKRKGPTEMSRLHLPLHNPLNIFFIVRSVISSHLPRVTSVGIGGGNWSPHPGYLPTACAARACLMR